MVKKLTETLDIMLFDPSGWEYNLSSSGFHLDKFSGTLNSVKSF
jgi:hypothetical protein